MLRLMALFVLLLVAAWPAVAAKRALVIGIDGYRNVTPLKNARADAESMQRALAAAGYAVSLYDKDLGQVALKDALRVFRNQVQGGDEVVVFFSGHGVQLSGVNYLLPADVRGDDEEQVKDDGIPLWKILTDLKERKPALTLAIIDACRNNPFEGKGKTLGGKGLAATSAATGQMVIYAAGEGQKALDRLSNDDPVRNGLFTRVFVREMEKPGVPVHQVLKNVREEVARLAGKIGYEQVPATYDQVLGDFYFRPPLIAGSKEEPVTPVAVPQRPSVASEPAPPAKPQNAPPSVSRDCPECPEMVVIPAGSFEMGSPAGEAGHHESEEPVHRVQIGKSFALGKTEVTVGEFRAFVRATSYRTDAETNSGEKPGCLSGDTGIFFRGPTDWRSGRYWDNPGFSQSDKHPVVCVSWNDAKAYIEWLKQKSGKEYRLSSEAEWEYAARGGTQTSRYWGDSLNDACRHANVADKTKGPDWSWRPKAVECSDEYFFTAPVGSFEANQFKLHDMIGNAWEWVEDCWHGNYTGAPSDGRAWTESSCVHRVFRGGSFNSAPAVVRTAIRSGGSPNYRSHNVGFRLARTLP